MRNKATVGIIGTGSYVPEKVLTNAELEHMVDTSDDWIMTRTGIKERRIAADDCTTADMATIAGRRALEHANIDPKDIEIIIVGTITPDMQFPSTSCLVQKNLGAEKAVCFDIGAACSGFVYALEIAQNFIASGNYKNALVVGSEKLSSIVDWTDRNTCVLFGDGAGAAVLSGSPDSHRLIDTYLASDGRAANLLMVPAGGSKIPASVESIENKLHFLRMEGREVFKYAVNSMEQAIDEVLKRAGLSSNDISLLITHQANLRIINALGKRLNLPSDRVYKNVHKYGNMSSASTAVGFDEINRQGKLKKGDILAMVVFGSGLTWGASLIEW